MNEIDDLANRQVPVKWVFALLGYLIAGAGSALAMTFYLGGYQTETKANFDSLRARMEIVERAAVESRADHDVLIEMRGDVKYLAERARERDGTRK